jgi:acyl-coenzyme A thioesterase PaaI-like protein
VTDHPLIERARTSPVPVAALIGFSIEPLGDGQAVGRLEAGPQHANPMGTLHGGILCDVADAASYAATKQKAAESSRDAVQLGRIFAAPT